jgi:hypothetical protein
MPQHYVTAFTPSYEPAAQRWLRSLETLGLQGTAIEYEDSGSWLANVAFKPEAVRTAMLAYPGDDIIWVDADAEVIAPFPTVYQDIAYYISQKVANTVYDFEYRRTVANTSQLRTPAGVIMGFRPNESVRTLVLTWQDICRKHAGHANDEQCLRYAMTFHPLISVQLLDSVHCACKHEFLGKQHGKPPRGMASPATEQVTLCPQLKER